jgi:hypothetical protein
MTHSPKCQAGRARLRRRVKPARPNMLQPEQDLFHSPELSAQLFFPLLVLRQLPDTPKRVQPSLTVHGSHNLSQSRDA